MKILIGLLLSWNCFAAVKITTWTCTTGALTGTCDVQIKVPGTFAVLNTYDPTWSGRQLVKLSMWFENRGAGDQVTAMQIKDIDNVTGLGANTVLGSLIDTTVALASQGMTVPPTGVVFTIDFPQSNAKTKIASGLYVVISSKKGTIGGDTFAVNLAWDDGT